MGYFLCHSELSVAEVKVYLRIHPLCYKKYVFLVEVQLMHIVTLVLAVQRGDSTSLYISLCSPSVATISHQTTVL